MKTVFSTRTARAAAFPALLSLFLLLSASDSFCSEKKPAQSIPLPAAFQPGEILKYEVSWSRVLNAGTAVMEVKEETLRDGKQGLSFTLTGRSTGLVRKLYRVNDTVRSVFDPELMHSLSYTLTEHVGKKKRHRSLFFDREQNLVVNRLNDDPPETIAVPGQALDGLASLYYLRTRKEFSVGKVFAIDVHDSGKNWTVEVHTLGRELVKTPAGEFSTIKIKTRPLHEGVFQNKGEVFLWLTDDERKVPVLMKSTIKVGSFVFTLQDMKPRPDTVPSGLSDSLIHRQHGTDPRNLFLDTSQSGV